MARVRDYAAEYATLKTRAYSAGLSTRAYRRARKDNPLKYGAPSTQQKIRRRLVKFEPVETANTTSNNTRAHLIQALAKRGATGDLAAIADRRISTHTRADLALFNKIYNRHNDATDGGNFWLTPEEYADVGTILYYRD